jgi:Zn-finger nucleic acid-binding protein
VHCPRDQAELHIETHSGIDVDRCPQCKGGWLDEAELSQLEATVESTEEQRRAMIEYANRPSDLACPKCGKAMNAFNYRAYNLEIDVCEQRHGFWLDSGEAIRVREIVEDRVKGLERAEKAEAEWGGFIDDLRKGPSFWDRLTGKG